MTLLAVFLDQSLGSRGRDSEGAYVPVSCKAGYLEFQDPHSEVAYKRQDLERSGILKYIEVSGV